VERRQLDHLDTPASEGRCGPDKQGIGPIAPDIFEGGIDLAAGVGIENLDLQSQRASGRFEPVRPPVPAVDRVGPRRNGR
jgi:hypothetical protein